MEQIKDSQFILAFAAVMASYIVLLFLFGKRDLKSMCKIEQFIGIFLFLITTAFAVERTYNYIKG